MSRTFIIESFRDRAEAQRWDAFVAIDVIRATTTAITAAAHGLRCLIVQSEETARKLSAALGNALLAGEMHGECPDGFEMQNSPSAMAAIDNSRPLILLSSSGTRLMDQATSCAAAYAACFRNANATAETLISEKYARVAVVGAETLGEFREEDRICCGWIGARLASAGYAPGDARTAGLVRDWGDARPEDCVQSKSVDYLRRTGQLYDLEYILSHINDLDSVYEIRRRTWDQDGPAIGFSEVLPAHDRAASSTSPMIERARPEPAEITSQPLP